MKFLVSLLLVMLLSFAIGLYVPFWAVAVVVPACLVGLFISQKPVDSFSSSFIAIFLLWAILSWWIDHQNNSLLSQKIAQILPLQGSTLFLILITALCGALVAGFSSLTAAYMRRLFKSEN